MNRDSGIARATPKLPVRACAFDRPQFRAQLLHSFAVQSAPSYVIEIVVVVGKDPAPAPVPGLLAARVAHKTARFICAGLVLGNRGLSETP